MAASQVEGGGSLAAQCLGTGGEEVNCVQPKPSKTFQAQLSPVTVPFPLSSGHVTVGTACGMLFMVHLVNPLQQPHTQLVWS